MQKPTYKELLIYQAWATCDATGLQSSTKYYRNKNNRNIESFYRYSASPQFKIQEEEDVAAKEAVCNPPLVSSFKGHSQEFGFDQHADLSVQTASNLFLLQTFYNCNICQTVPVVLLLLIVFC